MIPNLWHPDTTMLPLFTLVQDTHIPPWNKYIVNRLMQLRHTSYNLVPYCMKPRPTHLVPNNALSTYCMQPQDIHMSGDNLSFNLLHTTTRHACYISITRADLHVVSVHCIQIYPCLLSLPHPNKTTRVVKVFPELILQPSQDTACAGALFYSLTLSYHMILWWVHPDLPSD